MLCSALGGTLFVSVAFLTFLGMTALPAQLAESAIVNNERASQSYNAAQFLLAHSVVDTVVCFAMALICTSIFYFAPTLVREVNHFWTLVLIMWLMFTAGDALTMAVSAVVRIFIPAVAALCFLYGMWFCTMSFFVYNSQIGWWWRWCVGRRCVLWMLTITCRLQYWCVAAGLLSLRVSSHLVVFCSNFLFYGFGASMWNEFGNRTLVAACNTAFYCFPPDQFPAGVPGEAILQPFGFESRLWVNCLVVAGYFLLFRAATWVWLHFFASNKS